MDRALWLLLSLRLRGFVRTTLRTARTLKGLLLMVFTVGFFGLMMSPLALDAVLARNSELISESRETLRDTIPLAMAAYTVLSMMTSLGERAIYFSPSEVTFLFPGPFSRRQLLFYSITAQVLSAAFIATLLATSCRTFLPWWPASFCGVFFGFLFIHGVVLIVQLLAETISQSAFTRRRRIALAVTLLAAGYGFVQVLSRSFDAPWGTIAHEFRTSPAGRVLSSPFDVFALLITSRSMFPDLLGWSALAALMNGLVYAMVFRLDRNFMESSVRVSRVLQERFKRQTRGGIFAMHTPRETRRSWFARLPFWGGFGPTANRQLAIILTGSQTFIALSAMVGLIGTATALVILRRHPENQAMAPQIVAGAMAYLTLLASSQGPWAFRGDYDHLDTLKSLPLHPVPLAFGQLVPIVLMFTMVESLVFGCAGLVLGGDGWVWFALAAYSLPWNALMFVLENILFLHFPARLVPGVVDIPTIGRVMLTMMVKTASMAVLFAVAAIVGIIAYYFVPSLGFAMVAGWCVLVGTSGLLVLLAARSFRHFDLTQRAA